MWPILIGPCLYYHNIFSLVVQWLAQVYFLLSGPTSVNSEVNQRSISLQRKSPGEPYVGQGMAHIFFAMPQLSQRCHRTTTAEPNVLAIRVGHKSVTMRCNTERCMAKSLINLSVGIPSQKPVPFFENLNRLPYATLLQLRLCLFFF